jgi:hypothetical protein
VNIAAEHSIAKIKLSLMAQDLAISDIKGFIVNEKTNEFTIRDINDCLP